MFTLPFRPAYPANQQAVQAAAAPTTTIPAGLPASTFDSLYKMHLEMAFRFYEEDKLLLCYRACMDLVENPHASDWIKVRALKLLALLSSIPATSHALLTRARILCDAVRTTTLATLRAEVHRRHHDVTMTQEDRQIQDNFAWEAWQARDKDIAANAARVWELEQEAARGRNLFGESGKAHLVRGGIEEILAGERLRWVVEGGGVV